MSELTVGDWEEKAQAQEKPNRDQEKVLHRKQRRSQRGEGKCGVLRPKERS